MERLTTQTRKRRQCERVLNYSTSSSCMPPRSCWELITRGAIDGSRWTSKWNTCGCSVCCKTCNSSLGCPQTATAFPRWSTPFSRSPAARSSSPNCTSCRKNLCTASWSFILGKFGVLLRPLAVAFFLAKRPTRQGKASIGIWSVFGYVTVRYLRSRSFFLKSGSLWRLWSK